jgi:hypothetical protein
MQIMLVLLGTVITSVVGYFFINNALQSTDDLFTWIIVFFGWPFIVPYFFVALIALQFCYASIWKHNHISTYFFTACWLLVPFALSLITSAYIQTSLAVSISLFACSFFIFLISPARFEASHE